MSFHPRAHDLRENHERQLNDAKLSTCKLTHHDFHLVLDWDDHGASYTVRRCVSCKGTASRAEYEMYITLLECERMIEDATERIREMES